MSASSKPILTICDALCSVLRQRSCSLAVQGHLSHVRGVCSSSRSLAAKSSSGTAARDAGKDTSATQRSPQPTGSSTGSGAHRSALPSKDSTSTGGSSTTDAPKPGSTAASSPSAQPGPSTAPTQQAGATKPTQPPATTPSTSTSASGPTTSQEPDTAGTTPATTMTAQAAAASSIEGSIAGGAGTVPAVAAIIPKAALPTQAAQASASGQAASAQSASAQATSSAVTPASPLTAATERLQLAGATLNRLTGYDMIAELKGRVAAADERLQELKRRLQASKADYEARISEQTRLQKELNALLQRKGSWAQDDVQRFTQLYANEHATEQAVAAAKAEYARLGEAVEDAQLAMMSTIRERYTQEQLWSDHIRQASTWWTWGLMGLHFASFVSVYAFLEPRKRAALREALAHDAQQQAEQTRAAFRQALAAVAAGVGAGGAVYAESGEESEGSSSNRANGSRGDAPWNRDRGGAGGWEALAAAGLAGAGAGAADGGGAGTSGGGAGSEALAGLGEQLGCVLEEVRGLQKQLDQLQQQQQQQQEQGRLRRGGNATTATDAELESGDLLFNDGLTSTEDSQGSVGTAQRPAISSDHVHAPSGLHGAVVNAWRRLGDKLWPNVSVSGAQVVLLATGSAVTGAAVAVLLASRK